MSREKCKPSVCTKGLLLSGVDDLYEGQLRQDFKVGITRQQDK
jgi:hypothetical protein